MASIVSEAGRKQDPKTLKIIARSLFRELRDNGYDSQSIVSLSSELLELVTSDLREESDSVAAAS